MHDQQRQIELFSERMVDALNGAALCLMTSIGHRTGLFDVLSKSGGTTSEELAERAGLNERYVREWLGAMVSAKVVEVDPESGRYALPPAHSACLTREATPNNLAVFAQYIAILGAVEDDVVDCFRHGGGVPYQRYARFHEVMAEDSGQTVLSSLFDAIIPLVPGLAERLDRGIRALDVGCGRGRAVNALASRFPNSRFVGMDLSPEAVAEARGEASRLGLANVEFVSADLSTFDRDANRGEFDLVTAFDAIHDQARPRAVLEGIRRALKPDGVFLMQDIRGSSHHHGNLDHPIGTLLYTISCMHCMTVSLAQGGEGLGAMWGQERARAYLTEAGFTEVSVNALPHDFQNSYYVATVA